jgi:hypothetical protein
VKLIQGNFRVLTSIGFFNIEGLAAGIGIFVCTVASGALIALTFGLYICAIVIQYLVVSIAPLAIAAALWQKTFKFFSGWLAAAVGSGLLIVMLAVLMTLLLGVELDTITYITNAMKDSTANRIGLVGDSLAIVVIWAVGAFIALRLEGVAQTIAGGVYMGAGEMSGRITSGVGTGFGKLGQWANGSLPPNPAPPQPTPGAGHGGQPGMAGASLSGNSPWGAGRMSAKP